MKSGYQKICVNTKRLVVKVNFFLKVNIFEVHLRNKNKQISIPKVWPKKGGKGHAFSSSPLNPPLGWPL